MARKNELEKMWVRAKVTRRDGEKDETRGKVYSRQEKELQT